MLIPEKFIKSVEICVVLFFVFTGCRTSGREQDISDFLNEQCEDSVESIESETTYDISETDEISAGDSENGYEFETDFSEAEGSMEILSDSVEITDMEVLSDGADSKETEIFSVIKCSLDDECKGKFNIKDPCVFEKCSLLFGICVVEALADGTECSDSNVCTENDRCYKSKCTGKKIVCDDGNTCTENTCDPEKGCVFIKKSGKYCNDSNPCTLGDMCSDGECKGFKNICPCKTDDDCSAYEAPETCDGTLRCIDSECMIEPASIISCDTGSGKNCTVNTCDSNLLTCMKTAVSDGRDCDDGNRCTDKDSCMNGTCVSGKELVCDDGNTCTADMCDPFLGCIFVNNNEKCDDSDPCTEGDYCSEGHCMPGKDSKCPDTCKPEKFLKCGVEISDSTINEKSTKIIEKYSCNDFSYQGAELAYSFAAQYDGIIKVSLPFEQGTAKGDILILKDNKTGCDPAQCIAFGLKEVSFKAEQNNIYFIVIDGYDGWEGDFTIRVECFPFKETFCNDGIDNDSDGKTDCSDSDCTGTEFCPVKVCTSSFDLKCGDTDLWGNYFPGSTNAISSYSCADGDFKSQEYAYKFSAFETGTVDVKLADKTFSGSLFIIKEKYETCYPKSCIEYGADNVSFQAVKDNVYYFVVDGYDEGIFRISVSCYFKQETVCTDNIDNDADGLTDCNDKDCVSDPACPSCIASENISCGSSVEGNNTKDGSTDIINNYSCNAFNYEGNEYAYSFKTDKSQKVAIKFSSKDSSTDIIVISPDIGQDSSCKQAFCLTFGINDVKFDAEPDREYFIVVDGYNGASGNYKFTVSCTPL